VCACEKEMNINFGQQDNMQMKLIANKTTVKEGGKREGKKKSIQKAVEEEESRKKRIKKIWKQQNTNRREIQINWTHC
jgi:NH3-dependent NAD+ synthetase